MDARETAMAEREAAVTAREAALAAGPSDAPAADAPSDDAPKPPTVDEMKAELTRRGISFHHKAGPEKLAALLA